MSHQKKKKQNLKSNNQNVCFTSQLLEKNRGKNDKKTVEIAQLWQHNRGNYTTPTIYQKKRKIAAKTSLKKCCFPSHFVFLKKYFPFFFFTARECGGNINRL